MAGKIPAYLTEADAYNADTHIASQYGNGWMRLNRSGNYKDTINVLPEEVKLSELANSEIKDIKLDILNDYFGRTLITAQGNIARIIIKDHPDNDQSSRKVKPKFFYSIDAGTGKEVKDTENFKPGSGFSFADDPETKIRASFVEETVGEGKNKVTYYGFNRARYKNAKKQLYPTWNCTENPGVETMAFVSRTGNPEAYCDIVFYRINRGQNRIGLIELDGNTGTVGDFSYSLDIDDSHKFTIGRSQYVAVYQPEISLICSSDGELAPLEYIGQADGEYIPAPNETLSTLMYNDILSQHNLATRANINEYAPIGGSLPDTQSPSELTWTDRSGASPKEVIVSVPISKVDFTPSKLGLKTAEQWAELDEANRLYDDTPIWLAEIVIPISTQLANYRSGDDLDGYSAEAYFGPLPTNQRLLLRIPCKPISGPISTDPDNYFGFVPINDQYLEIANGPHLWHGPLRTGADDISRLGSEAKQLKGKATFQNDALGFMGVIYRGLVNNSIGARKWLEWQVNLWLTTYMRRTNPIFKGGVSDIKCTLQTTDGVIYSASVTQATLSRDDTRKIDNFINLNEAEIVYYKDLAAYRDNVFKQRDGFIDTVNLNNVDEVAKSIESAWVFDYRVTGTPNKEYWMKYIIPRLDYSELFMRVGVMTDGQNLRPTYACQDIPLHGFIHTGLSFLNRIPENNPDDRKANTLYAAYGNPNEPTQRTEYLHVGAADYMNGNRGKDNSPIGYFRLPANTEVNSIIGRYNFDSRNANATYIAQGNGWGFTGSADKDNWHRGNLHQLVNFEPSSTTRLFKDKPIYTMVPWENGQVDYQYIRGYLHGRVRDFNTRNHENLEYINGNDRINGAYHGKDIILGGCFPCLTSNYFNNRYYYDRFAPPAIRHTIMSNCDIAPLVRVASASPLLPHEWKPYEGNVTELIDGVSSTMIENPLYDYMDRKAWYSKAFDNFQDPRSYDDNHGYDYNKKGHPITTYDYHIDSISLLGGLSGLIKQFYLPNQNRQESIYSDNRNNNPRYRSVLYTRRRAVLLGIGKTYGEVGSPGTVHDLKKLGDKPGIENSPQSWLITAGLDILIEHAKRMKGTPKDLKHAFAKLFAKHGIPDSKWLPQWEEGPEVFFLRNEIWLDYFFASAKLVPNDVIVSGSTATFIKKTNVECGINVTSGPCNLYSEPIDYL